MYRKDVAEQAGQYDPRLEGAEDWGYVAAHAEFLHRLHTRRRCFTITAGTTIPCASGCREKCLKLQPGRVQSLGADGTERWHAVAFSPD